MIRAEHAALIQPMAGLEDNAPLSLDRAIDLAVRHNLDARVAAWEMLAEQGDVDLESLRSFPSVTGSVVYAGRSNRGASSSESISTGSQSLENSYSTEQYRYSAELSTSWNLLDAALAVLQTRTAEDEALIAQERYKKVLQTIERDVYRSFWLAYAYQNTKDTTNKLVQRAQAYLKAVGDAQQQGLISKARAAEQSQKLLPALIQMQTAQDALAAASTELKTLLSAPQNTMLVLADPAAVSEKPDALLRADLLALEEEALLARPEMRESIVQKRISARAVRQEIWRTFPGAELFISGNRDENKFLLDHTWISYTAKVAQNITTFLTLPIRYESAKNKENLEDARRLSLAMGIVTQVHLAHHRLAFQTELDALSQKASSAAEQIDQAAHAKAQEGFVSGFESLVHALQAQTARIENWRARAGAQDAAAALRLSLGRSALGNAGGAKRGKPHA